MNSQWLDSILKAVPTLRVAVVGDFFLDEYLMIDSSRDELSRETGLTAYQVVERRALPGAAGTVVNNLQALGCGSVMAVGLIGDDGRGLELSRGLEMAGTDTEYLLKSPERATPTYTKPMRDEGGTQRELNRLDIKNWSPTPQGLEARIIEILNYLQNHVDAIIIADQVEEEGCGVITRSVRDHLADSVKEYGTAPVFVDSRSHMGEYRHVILKPNEAEARWAVGSTPGDTVSIREIGRRLQRQTHRPVFLTRGEKGQLVFSRDAVWEVDCLPAAGPVDIVGAGDSTMAGIVTAHCAGLPLPECALFGNLVASVTVTKLGTTGTASPAELQERMVQYAGQKLIRRDDE